MRAEDEKQIGMQDIGVSNEYYRLKHIEIKEDLKDDIKTLKDAFIIFNNLLWDGKLDNSTVIQISSKMRNYVNIRPNGSWTKENGDNEEKCDGIEISDRVLELGTEKTYMYLVIAMIMLADSDRYEFYSARRKRYKRLVTRHGTYFSKEFAVECEKYGIAAEAVYINNRKDEKQFAGRFTYEPKEEFKRLLEKTGLNKRKFTCSISRADHGTEEQKDNENKNESKNDNGSSGRKQSSRLLVCPKCGLKIRATKGGVKVKCCSDEHPGEEVYFEEKDKKESREES